MRLVSAFACAAVVLLWRAWPSFEEEDTPTDTPKHANEPTRTPPVLKDRRHVFPERLMPIAQFVRRAEELDGEDKLAAFYCRRYALVLAVKICCADPAGAVDAFEAVISRDGEASAAAGKAAVAKALDAEEGAEELCVLHETMRQFYGRSHRRGDKLPPAMYHAAIAARQRLKDECNTPASLRLAGDEALPFPDYFSPISPLIRYAEKLDAQGPNRESQLVAFYARRAALMAVARLVAADPTAASGAFDAALAKADAAALRRARAAVSTAAQAAYARAEETRSERPAERARRGETDASRAIARDFHRAWCFFEVLRQFGAVDAALAIKASYAKYAATQALK